MKISEIVHILEEFAPLSLQESYDNSGLQVGNDQNEIHSALLCLDVTLDVVNEAIQKNISLIISHHPLIFKGLTKLTGRGTTEKIVELAIKSNIAIYSCHTNLDIVSGGTSFMLAEKLGLKNSKLLTTQTGKLKKLITFVPLSHADQVRNALFEAGGGTVGNYDHCSFNLTGFGTFRGNENANPYVGNVGKDHQEEEIRIETIFPGFIQGKIVNSLLKAHPYEEVAYDIYTLDNAWNGAGFGVWGEFNDPLGELEFFNLIKKIFNVKLIRHSQLMNKPIKKVAVCGGSGSFLISQVAKFNVDAYITADIKYHQFFEAENKFLLADIGHYESEQYTPEIFYRLINKKFPNFALHFSKINTNSINYY